MSGWPVSASEPPELRVDVLVREERRRRPEPAEHEAQQKARAHEGGEQGNGCGTGHARARAARGASTRSAVRAATDTSLSRGSATVASAAPLAGRLHPVLLLRRLVGDEEAAVRALEAEVPLGLAEQVGLERLAAVRAVDREGLAAGGRSRAPAPKVSLCR